MKFGLTILLIVALAGCSRESVPSIPTAPAPPGAAPGPPAPPSDSALLWVMVITETGGCIEGATIQIVRAEGAGERIPQKTPCGAWDAVDNLWKRNRGEDRPRPRESSPAVLQEGFDDSDDHYDQYDQ